MNFESFAGGSCGSSTDLLPPLFRNYITMLKQYISLPSLLDLIDYIYDILLTTLQVVSLIVLIAGFLN